MTAYRIAAAPWNREIPGRAGRGGARRVPGVEGTFANAMQAGYTEPKDPIGSAFASGEGRSSNRNHIYHWYSIYHIYIGPYGTVLSHPETTGPRIEISVSNRERSGYT